jgi:hypothetical protein
MNVADGSIGRLRAMPQRLNDRSRAVVDSALDRVFAEPYAVTTPDDFVRLMVERGGAHGPNALATAGAITAFVRSATPIAERLFKVASVSSSAAAKTPFMPAKLVKYAVAAIPVALSLTGSARRGVHELQVLASFLIHRFRAEGIDPDRGLVRALTVAITLDPDRRPQLDAGAGKIGAGLGGQWIFRSVGHDSTTAVRKRAELQLGAVERLDLQDLAVQWDRRDAQRAT